MNNTKTRINNSSLDDKSISNHYAIFLDTLPWTHFATFTTKLILSQNAAPRLATKIASQINAQMPTNHLKMFWVAEAFKSGDGYHLHILLYSPRNHDINRLKLWYENSHGFCKILPKRGPASAYVVKFIHKEQTEYGLI